MARTIVRSLMFPMIIAICMIVISSRVSAQQGIPAKLTYQGVLIDTTGIPVCDSVWTVDLTLYTSASGGTGIWTERHTVNTSGGVFGVILALAACPELVAFARTKISSGFAMLQTLMPMKSRCVKFDLLQMNTPNSRLQEV